MKIIVSVLIVASVCVILFAGEADVIKAQVVHEGNNLYTFHVTVQHADTGWKHYASKWDVVGTNGRVYGTRTLYHPHVNEQPFTRSLSGVKIPRGVKTVIIRAHDSIHKYGGKIVTVKLQ